MIKKKLLLIDKSHELTEIMKKKFDRDGFEVYCAVSISQAHDILRSITPDALVIDNDLPDGSGVNLCSQLHDTLSAPIMLTASVRDVHFPALDAGASDFVKKPFDLEQMKQHINTMIQLHNSVVSMPVKQIIQKHKSLKPAAAN